MSETKEYILLARKGLFNERLRDLEPPDGFVDHQAPFVVQSELAGGRDIRIIHSIAANGPKLVALDNLAVREINRQQDVHVLPVFNYTMPFTKRQRSGGPNTISPAGYPGSVPGPDRTHARHPDYPVTLTVTRKNAGNNVPVGSGMLVTAFSDYAANIGDEKSTDHSGMVRLALSENIIERIYCPCVWAWGAFLENIPVGSISKIELPPLSINFTDCVRRYYAQSRFASVTGVRVGVIDTGVGNHDDLNVIGTYHVKNNGKIENDQPDRVVSPHGTFVAGIIGAEGNLYPNLRGLAPGVQILSYRVFGGLGTATTYALMNAIDHAVKTTRCDILNLSIEDGPNDTALHQAITDARDNGILVIAAAGNDERRPVNYPAAFPEAIAVSAMGCKDTIPSGALEETFVNMSPGGLDPNEFIASFSNVGVQIAITAPGVGVLSTLPNNGYGACSGTSMAAPVVTGAIASLLSRRPDICGMPWNRARSDAIRQLLIDNCVKRGFGPEYEGYGMPDPARV